MVERLYYKSYSKNQIETADQGTLILMMYEGGIRFLKQAKIKLIEKDYLGKGRLLQKSNDILFELINALKPEVSPIADNLKKIYLYLIKRILEANEKKNISAIDEAIQILSELKESWEAIIRKESMKNCTNKTNTPPDGRRATISICG